MCSKLKNFYRLTLLRRSRHASPESINFYCKNSNYALASLDPLFSVTMRARSYICALEFVGFRRSDI